MSCIKLRVEATERKVTLDHLERNRVHKRPIVEAAETWRDEHYSLTWGSRTPLVSAVDTFRTRKL